MLGAVAGLASRGGVEVEGVEAAAVSYPVSSATSASFAGAEPGASPGCRGGPRRPGREQQQQAGVLGRADLAPLVRVEDRQQPGAAVDRLAAVDLDRAGDDQQPGAFMHLMLLRGSRRRAGG